jgi:glycogen(starch) synthase
MAERLLGDDALRARLVAEAGEHVLRFDWADVARQTEAVYEELSAGSRYARSSTGPAAATRTARADRSRP